MSSNNFWIKNIFFGGVDEANSFKVSAMSLGSKGTYSFRSFNQSLFTAINLSNLITNTININTGLLFVDPLISASTSNAYHDNWRINLTPLITGSLPSPFIVNSLTENSNLLLDSKFEAYDFHHENIDAATLFGVIDGTSTMLDVQESINSLTSMFKVIEPQDSQMSNSFQANIDASPDMFQKMDHSGISSDARPSYFQPLNISFSSMFQFNKDPFIPMKKTYDPNKNNNSKS